MVLVSLTLALLAQNKLVFDAPKDSKPEDLRLTAKAIHARISEYGYKEIVVWEGIDKITVESTLPITDVMRPKIEKLAMRRAYSIEIWFSHQMTKAESEQYRQPGMASPPGTVWYRYNDGTYCLLSKAPVLQVSGMVTWRPAKDVQGIFPGPFNENLQHLAWNETATKKLLECRDLIPKCRLFIDGLNVGAQINITFTGNTMKWTLSNWDWWDVTGICLNHPLPLQLTK